MPISKYDTDAPRMAEAIGDALMLETRDIAEGEEVLFLSDELLDAGKEAFAWLMLIIIERRF